AGTIERGVARVGRQAHYVGGHLFCAQPETGMKRRGGACLFCFFLAGWFPANAQEKEASKQAVEKRLRDVEKEKYSLSLEKAIAALAEAGSFGQVALSPDGKKVGWVEELRDARGVETGRSAILAAPI